MKHILILFFLSAIAAGSGCGSADGELSSDDMSSYSPVPMENVVMLETDSSNSLSAIAGSLVKYQEAYINSICVRLPRSFDPAHLKALVDSCHQAGINFFLHTTRPDQSGTAWVKRYNVDGFHCVGSLSGPTDYWQSKIDSLNLLKPVLMIAHNATDELKWAGFASSSDDGFTTALDAVMLQDLPVSRLDTILIAEKIFFTKTFPALRSVPVNVNTGNKAAAEAAMLATFVQPGVPYITEEQLNTHGDFLQTYLGLYTASPILQYGDCIIYNAGTRDVFAVIREFQGKKILFAINLRNKPAAYNWPENLMGIKTELVMGETITRNGGQELPPYGYQVLTFENIVGMDALEMDNKK